MRTKRMAKAVIVASFLASAFLSCAQPGSLDMTFNPGSGADGQVYCMALQTNGQIVIGGAFTHFNGANENYVARLNADGSLDSSFYAGVGPVGSYPPLVGALAVEADGEILIGGGYSGWNGLSWNEPIGLRTGGSVDTAFNTSAANGGGVLYSGSISGGGTVLAIALQSDGKVLIVGDFARVSLGNGNWTNLNNIARLDTNGAVDGTFNNGTGANGSVNALGLQSSGQIVIGGSFTSVNNSNLNYLARLNTDGSVDGSFNSLLQDGNVQSLAVTPQDEILIGGGFTSINGYSRTYIACLNADGSLDTNFNPGVGANSPVTAIALQPDGKVIISGLFTSFNGVSVAGGLARLNTNGTLDVTFNPGSGPNVPGYTVASVILGCQPDGKTLIAGNFTSFNGTNINRIARLNSDTSSATLNLLSPQLYFGMSLTGVVSNTYLIESTSQLNTPSLWTPLFNVTLQTNPQFIVDTNPAGGQRFYRAVQVSP
jgi:uncharacterized delta-60 repeat protein